MANWCYNFLQFEGNSEAVNNLMALFMELESREKATTHGQLPDFIAEKAGFMSSINCYEDNVSYETRWWPNVEVIVQITEKFKLGFTLSYNELDNLIFGEYVYKNSVLTDFCLDSADFDLYDINPENEDTWLFEGEVYLSDFEILDILLERRKKLPV